MNLRFFLRSWLVAGVLLPEFLSAQFISSDQDKGTYQNYSSRNYENYSQVLLRRRFYDNFGNFLVDGLAVFGLSEEQRPSLTEFDIPASSITKTGSYQNYFSNLVIVNDSYSGFSSRLMIGDAIRTKFTSLTFDKARFNGIRWDAATAKYRGTILASRVSDPIRVNLEGTFSNRSAIRRIREWTTYLFGGHFETDIGDVMTLGATYINQHQRRTTADTKESSIKGVPANAVPRVIFIRIKDDSQGDNSGPIIYGPPQIIVNGKAHPMTNAQGQSPDPNRVDLKFPIHYWVIRDFVPLYVATYPFRDTVSQTNYVNYREKATGTTLPAYPYLLPSDRKDVEYNLTYAYVIPPQVYSIAFTTILANDYKIDGAHDWINNVDKYETGFRSHGDSVTIGSPAVPTFFRTLVRADGNVKDASNRRIVTFSYGLSTGMAVYGLNFTFNWSGFKIEGEFAQSGDFFKYPINKGALFENKGTAYFIRGSKKMGRLTIGGERYNIDPTYTSLLNLYTMDNSYYGFQNTPVIPEFQGYDPTASGISLDRQTGGYIPGQAGGAIYSLVDDNDDNDRWEDGFYHYNVLPFPDPRNGDVINYNYRFGIPGLGSPFLLGYRQNNFELVGLGDIIRRPDSGIFPGKDKDRDGIPDDDRNSDGTPDYVQDFLTYYIDPPFFNYGDDWNNNGVIDEQENDILPDYPYNPDLDGYHLFAGFDILTSMNLRLGMIREKAPAQGGKNLVDYLRWTYEASTPRFGGMNLFYALKRVHDNIPNNGYQFLTALTINSSIPDFVFDPMEYKSTTTNQLYVGTFYTQIPGLRIENNVRYEHNKQRPIGLGLRDPRRGTFLDPNEQKEGRITKLGIVNKVDYTLQFFGNKLALIPQLKVRTQKIVRFEELITGQKVNTVAGHVQEMMPIIRLDYKLTDRTDLRMGLQGFFVPGTGNTFAYQIKDLKNPENDENRSTFAISISNRSAYGGYNVVLDMGYKITTRLMPRTTIEELKERKESIIFVTLFAGF